MPRIDAPTVAEHHSRRRADLLRAGGDLLATGGVDAVTLASVGAATGLARSSVYQYFDSTPALIAAVVEDAFPRATAELATAVAAARTPAGRVDAYVRTALALAGDATHRSMYALGALDLPAGCRARLAELHAEQDAPLRAAVAELGVPDPELTTTLLLGLLRAAAGAVMAGEPLAEVQRRTLALVHHGLGQGR